MSINNSSLFSTLSEGMQFFVTVVPSNESTAYTQIQPHSRPFHPTGAAYPPRLEAADRCTIESALNLLEKYHRTSGEVLHSSERVVDFLRLKFELCEREIVSVVFLDHRNQFIALEELFYGTLEQVQIYPREIAKRALVLNAAAIILVHNHPSGHAGPTEQDCSITHELRDTLRPLGIRVRPPDYWPRDARFIPKAKVVIRQIEEKGHVPEAS